MAPAERLAGQRALQGVGERREVRLDEPGRGAGIDLDPLGGAYAQEAGLALEAFDADEGQRDFGGQFLDRVLEPDANRPGFLHGFAQRDLDPVALRVAFPRADARPFDVEHDGIGGDNERHGIERGPQNRERADELGADDAAIDEDVGRLGGEDERIDLLAVTLATAPRETHVRDRPEIREQLRRAVGRRPRRAGEPRGRLNIRVNAGHAE